MNDEGNLLAAGRCTYSNRLSTSTHSHVATSFSVAHAMANALAAAPMPLRDTATLKDIAMCEGMDVESLFESEVEYYEGVLVEE